MLLDGFLATWPMRKTRDEKRTVKTRLDASQGRLRFQRYRLHPEPLGVGVVAYVLLAKRSAMRLTMTSVAQCFFRSCSFITVTSGLSENETEAQAPPSVV